MYRELRRSSQIVNYFSCHSKPIKEYLKNKKYEKIHSNNSNYISFKFDNSILPRQTEIANKLGYVSDSSLTIIDEKAKILAIKISNFVKTMENHGKA